MRRHIAWLVPSLLGLFALLAYLVNRGALLEWELAVYAAVSQHMSSWLTAVLRLITHLGDPTSMVLLCCILLVSPRLHHRYGLPAASATAAAAALNQVLKRLFRRERPDILRLITERGYSFPSGHAMTNSALYLLLALLLLRHLPRSGARRPLAILCLCPALLIGISRVYLGVHYAGDVLAGWTLGSAIALSVYAVWDRYWEQGGER